MSYRKIFLICDPARRRTPAMHKAIQLARESGASLHLALYDHSAAIAAVDLVSGEVARLARDAFVEERERWLDRIARRLADVGIRAHSEVSVETPVHEAIVSRILELAPDLVIKDVHHESALKRLLFTPLDWHLLRLCPAPLLLVSGGDHLRPRRVVAAVDTLESQGAGMLDDRVFDQAQQLAAQTGAELHVAHVFEGVPATVSAQMESVRGILIAYEQLTTADRESFERFWQRRGLASQRAHRLAGEPSGSLSGLVTRGDVLVLGTVRRTGFARLIMGSTAERVLERVPCDVLAVKPDGFRADLARHLGLTLASETAQEAA